MAVERTNDLPRPDDLEMAKEMGCEYMRTLLRIRKVDLSDDPKAEAFFHNWGRKLGEQIFTEDAPWTIDEFQDRMRSAVEAA